MPTKTTSVFQDAWSGWSSFVREVTSGVFFGAPPAPRLKKPAKRPTKDPLKETRTKLHRPLPKRTKAETKAEKTLMKREVPEDVPKLQVDPPKPFKLAAEFLETPVERAKRITKKQMKKRTYDLLNPPQVTRARRHLLFMNPGTARIEEAHKAFLQDEGLPKWALPFEKHFTFDDNWLYFQDLPMAHDQDKRDAVKKLYFDPKEGSTIQPITDKLRLDWANVSKRNVTSILRSFEVYQLNFGRRHPPKVLSRMSMKQPGVILADMFFPSKNLGWRKIGGVLTMMDAWSRYLQCYAVERKTKALVKLGMERFMRDFTSLGHLPKVLLSDKGTDLAPAAEVMEAYRRKPGKLVLHSTTGKPVMLVESTQAQIQRRMQVFRTAGLTDDPSEILADICTSINNQKRPDRGNLTPIQLLQLNKEEREHINALYRDRTHIPEVKGLRELRRGHHVRLLLMTFKEQVQNKTKGFAPKWSRDIFTVRKKQSLQGNPEHYRYFLHGEQESYFRHELLWVPKNVDTEIVDGYVVHQEQLIAEDFSDYDPEEDS